MTLNKKDLTDKELRALLPSEKFLKEYKFENESAKERLFINYVYALSKYNDILTYGNIPERKSLWTKMVKWAVREILLNEKK